MTRHKLNRTAEEVRQDYLASLQTYQGALLQLVTLGYEYADAHHFLTGGSPAQTAETKRVVDA